MDVKEKTASEKRLIPLYKQPWHGSYKSMMDRCYRKSAENFDMYGGRGIKVCDEWFFNPYAFGEWAENNGFQNGLTLERKDVNGNYCPENCTWATPKQQANNRRNTIFLEWNGQRKSVHEWADELGVSASTLKNRYYRGWSVEEIMTLSVSRRKPRRGNKLCVG